MGPYHSDWEIEKKSSLALTEEKKLGRRGSKETGDKVWEGGEGTVRQRGSLTARLHQKGVGMGWAHNRGVNRKPKCEHDSKGRLSRGEKGGEKTQGHQRRRGNNQCREGNDAFVSSGETG